MKGRVAKTTAAKARNGPRQALRGLPPPAVRVKIPPRPPSFGALQARLRPANYEDLPQDEQWAIDRKLRILDWDGK